MSQWKDKLKMDALRRENWEENYFVTSLNVGFIGLDTGRTQNHSVEPDDDVSAATFNPLRCRQRPVSWPRCCSSFFFADFWLKYTQWLNSCVKYSRLSESVVLVRWMFEKRRFSESGRGPQVFIRRSLVVCEWVFWSINPPWWCLSLHEIQRCLY